MEMNWYRTGGTGGIYLAHQLIMTGCAFATIAAMGYLLAILHYDFIDDARMSLMRPLFCVFQILLAVMLFLATFLGMTEPIRWLGMIGHFRGSGVFVMYLGAITVLHLDNMVGLVVGLACVGVGFFFVLYGQFWRERSSVYYKPLV
ncbi:Aste57867_13511 [Aphanomyces stellatus]|uniref:Aste57867_13511 protein n=1 Tax=Aphanomyces stellatus TaxID=120398 RepID=A0A485KYV0_9STRA|nr:hypothetical protein As57867_013461 [Aphanomyces stellatus]VFT90349.1 Aste57867_13511 [Aphanomyces stellatus]